LKGGGKKKKKKKKKRQRGKAGHGLKGKGTLTLTRREDHRLPEKKNPGEGKEKKISSQRNRKIFAEGEESVLGKALRRKVSAFAKKRENRRG